MLLLCGISIYTQWPPKWFGPWHVASNFISQFLEFSIMGFVSPLPWEFNGNNPGAPTFRRGLLQSVLLFEPLILALVALDGFFNWKAGTPFSWKVTLIYNLLFNVPVIIIVGNLLANREQIEVERVQAKLDAQRAQTRLLQSQLHPHVLFNAINGITELSRVNPGGTEQCLVALSDLLRRLLKASNQTTLPFREERKLVEDYLVLESLRLGKRLKLEWAVDPELEEHELPPLLLQPLVENAIKHGISPSVEGGVIRIEGRVEKSQIRLSVRNTGHWEAEGRADGIGIWNLRSRLELASKGKARFRLDREGEWTVAEIHFPVEPLHS